LIEEFSCLRNTVLNKNSIINYIGNCLYLDSLDAVWINNSSFQNNTINIEPNSLYGGNPCLYTNNFLSEVYITDSYFGFNQAFSDTNCINFVGSTLQINNSYFESNGPISNNPYINNVGTLSISADQLVMFNVTLTKNQAFKAAGIFFQNLNFHQQMIICGKVILFFLKKHLKILYKK